MSENRSLRCKNNGASKSFSLSTIAESYLIIVVSLHLFAVAIAIAVAFDLSLVHVAVADVDIRTVDYRNRYRLHSATAF